MQKPSALLMSVVSCVCLVSTVAFAQGPAGIAAIPLEPISAILDAFKTHRIVALGENPHRGQQGHAFRLSLVRHPRFAATVNDIVVEWGNARYQDVIDRFIGGEQISYSVLKRVWQDTVSAEGMWDVPMYEEFFRAVRSVNSSLPAKGRIRVLLGDPPIDWSAIYTTLDLMDWQAQRDDHPAHVIRTQVIAKQRRALVIYGDGHLSRQNRTSLVARLENGGIKVFTIDSGVYEYQASWPIPSLAMTRGTVLATRNSGVFDAFLYLGSRLTVATLPASLCEDHEYMEMRMQRLSLPPVGPWASPAHRLKSYCATVTRGSK